MRRLFIPVAVLALVVVGLAGSSSASGPDGRNDLTRPSDPAARVAAPAAPQSVFVAVTPCRIVDTRAGTGVNATPFGSGVTRTYYVGGTLEFAAQGGKVGGCGIPVGASAIAATVLAVSPASPGGVRAWPNGTAEPSANVLNHGTFTMGSGATVSLNPSTAYSLKIRSYGGPTDMVIDVSGYYVSQMAAFVDIDGSVTSATNQVVSAAHVGLGTYDVTFARNVSACAFQVTPYTFNWVAAVGPKDAFSATVYFHTQEAPITFRDTSFYIQAVC